MASVNLEKMKIDELKEHRKTVDKMIADYDNRMRRETLDQLKQLAEQNGFKLTDLVSASGKGSKQALEAKFRHPENPELTWSGRGRQPRWFKEQVEAGVDADKMAI